jgi:hypothetical protein
MEGAIHALAMAIQFACKMVIEFADYFFGLGAAWIAAIVMLIGFVVLMIWL